MAAVLAAPAGTSDERGIFRAHGVPRTGLRRQKQQVIVDSAANDLGILRVAGSRRRRIVLGIPPGRHRGDLVTIGGQRLTAECDAGDAPGRPVDFRGVASPATRPTRLACLLSWFPLLSS